jgi:hypothetical protein
MDDQIGSKHDFSSNGFDFIEAWSFEGKPLVVNSIQVFDLFNIMQIDLVLLDSIYLISCQWFNNAWLLCTLDLMIFHYCL